MQCPHCGKDIEQPILAKVNPTAANAYAVTVLPINATVANPFAHTVMVNLGGKS